MISRKNMMLKLGVCILSLAIIPMSLSLYQLSGGGIAGGASQEPFVPFLGLIILPVVAFGLLFNKKPSKYEAVFWIITAVISVICLVIELLAFATFNKAL